MALPTTDADWVTLLSLLHDSELPQLQLLDRYYEGTQPLAYMHPDIQREIGDRIRPVVINWPQLVVDAIDERLDVEGFRLPDEEEDDDDLWRVWQENNLDEESAMGRVDALTMKRSYLAVGTNEDDEATPLVTVESPLEMYTYVDPRTRKPLAALKRTIERDSLARISQQYATLYLPDRTVWYDWSGNAFKETQRDEHKLGEVPVVPLVNRARTADRLGRSELASVIPLSDAANKIATDMMVAAEFHSIPFRTVFGVGPDEFEDENGDKQSALQVIMGKMLAVPAEDGREIQAHEFSASSLTNFHDTINQLAKLVSSLAGLPPDYMGLTTDNPPSAESRLAGEIRLIKRAERKMVGFGGTYEQTARLVRRFQTGEWDPRLKRLETRWRDASAPTEAQSADAATKKFQAGIVPLRQTREDLGYTDAQIARMEEEDAKKAEQNPLADIARGLATNPLPQTAEPVTEPADAVA